MERAISKVLTGTEASPGSCDEEHPSACFLGDVIQSRMHLLMHSDVEAVQFFGAIEDKARDAALEGKDDVVVRHRLRGRLT